ncbi:terminase small subunit [Enterobacter hormaechei]
MFCREYLIDLNATQAAMRAGYGIKTTNRMRLKPCQNQTSNSELQKLKSNTMI